MVPKDERVRRYERALLMAVLGLAHALGQLEAAYLVSEEVQDVWKPFLVENRLWKLAKNPNPTVEKKSRVQVCWFIRIEEKWSLGGVKQRCL